MELYQKKCLPCEGFGKPLEPKEISVFLDKIKGWQVIENKKIEKNFRFKNFKEAMNFVNQVAELAEREQHHPNISIFYNQVKLELYTHTIGGLSENDFILAAKIDRLKCRPKNDEITK